MKTSFYSIILFLGILSFMPGCSRVIKGDGQLVRNKLIIKEYDKLTVACTSGEIHYVQSDSTHGLSITTDRNVQAMLEIKQMGKEISIKLKKAHDGTLVMPTLFTITASSKTLEEMTLVGDAEFNLDSPLRTKKLQINVAGSGDINMKDSLIVHKLTTSIAGSSTIHANKLDVDKLYAEIAGSGTYDLAGKAGYVSFEVAGKGKVDALDLEASEVNCEVAGYGNMALHATSSLNLEIAGIGRIKYKGSPKITQEGFAFVRKVN